MIKKKLKIIFAGTTIFSLEHLKSLFFSKHKVIAVLTKLESNFKKKNNITLIKDFSLKKKFLYFNQVI